jgi:hypothetical protein
MLKAAGPKTLAWMVPSMIHDIFLVDVHIRHPIVSVHPEHIQSDNYVSMLFGTLLPKQDY